MTGEQGSPSIYWFDQVGDAVTHSTMNKTAPTMKNYPVINADSAEIEKTCVKERKSKRQYLPSKRLLSREGVEGGSRE